MKAADLLQTTAHVNLAVLGGDVARSARIASLSGRRHRLSCGSDVYWRRRLPGNCGEWVAPCHRAAALVFEPANPGNLLKAHADWSGWLALATNVIAAVWYVGAVRPRAVVHVVGLGGLLLGVVLAGSIDSIFAPEIAWLAHHVLTLSWTLLGLLLLIVSWVSHGQDVLGPRFWPTERRTLVAEFLRRCFPERTTRAWVTLCGAFVVILALRATWVEPATPYWSVGTTFAVSVLLGALAIWARAPLYTFGSGLLFNVIGLLLFTAWSDPSQ